jgi:hypothetical protein
VELPEREETNDLMCVILRKDGSVERKPNGKIEKGDAIPTPGEGYFVGDLACRVVGHAYTPHLPHTWHLFLSESDAT